MTGDYRPIDLGWTCGGCWHTSSEYPDVPSSESWDQHARDHHGWRHDWGYALWPLAIGIALFVIVFLAVHPS
jgi:hypothetical protein